MVRLKFPQMHVLGLVLTASILLSGCAPATPPPPTSAPTEAPPTATTVPPTATATEVPPAEMTGSLSVLDWAGYDQKDFWTDFATVYPKVNVSFEIGASDADIFSKMKAGDQSDIFHPYTGWLQFYVDNGLAEEIDTGKLTNWGFEMGAPQQVQNQGWGRNTLKAGDELIVVGSRARDGSNRMNARNVTWAATGVKLGAASSEPTPAP